MPRFLPLPRRGCFRWLALLGYALGGLVLFILLLALGVFVTWKISPRFQGWVVATAAGMQAPAEERPNAPGLIASFPEQAIRATDVRGAGDIYRATNVWRFHFHFSEAEYAALGPNRIPMKSFGGPDGGPVLRNPDASRNGLAGMLGFEFPLSTARLEISGRDFTNIAVRFKGNGTFLGGIAGYKKPLKVDLNRHVAGREWGGRSTFNLANLSADMTCLSDALAYEFFRDAGVPAPRTAFARVFHTIAGRAQAQNRLLGLYALIENPDAAWAREAFGGDSIALFKPVTLTPFSDLGPDWTNYAGIYDPKTKTTAAHHQRVIDFAQLVSHASEADFNRRLPEFLDLDEAATFFACEVLLANYDGILSQGQNYLMYLGSRRNRFGFIPWDLDHSWGEFPFVGNADERERSSIQHPWVSTNRFLERVWAQPDFQKQYRHELTRLLDQYFTPARLESRIDALAAVIRPAVAEMSKSRLEKFEQAVSSEVVAGNRDGNGPMDANRPGWQIKRFVRARAEHVRRQLAGQTEGVIPPRMKF